MGLHNTLPNDLQEVDIIIVGGGSAGCVVAARLSDIDPKISVLLLERGKNNANEPEIYHPALFSTHLEPASRFMTGHKAHKSSHLANREIVVSCGNVLGGGSSVNAMIYSRPQRSDFDAWNTLGWSTDDMLPYSKRFETYHGPDSKGLHGADGPIHISGEYRCLGLERDFIDAFDSHGHPQVEDINDMETSNGVMSALRYVNLDGIRQDAATTYIHPRLKDGRHPNLHVIVETEVEMVVLKYNRAIGVKCAPTKTHKSGNSLGSRIIRARKMVVLSAGAMATPLILERSGIGSIDVLERSGVPVVSEVPGVGCNYEDHHNILWGYYSGGLEPCETLDVWLDDRLNYTALQQNISKRLAWNGTDAQCKLRPTDSDVAGLSQAFREVWDRDYEMHSDKPLLIASSVGGFPAKPSSSDEQYFAITTFSLYPLSRGHIHITDPGIDSEPDFEAGFLSDKRGIDLETQVWAYKRVRDIARRMKAFRGEYASTHPSFAPESKAACVRVSCPSENIQMIEYTAEDDSKIEQYIRENLATTWHSIGTCRMAPRHSLGVVDASLSVYGVDRLKVADLSIPPSNVGANTNSTALAIGEKAADIIIEELGLCQP